MKNGMPDKESKGKKSAAPHVKADMKAGIAHLREHHKEEHREMDRSYETGNVKEPK